MDNVKCVDIHWEANKWWHTPYWDSCCSDWFCQFSGESSLSLQLIIYPHITVFFWVWETAAHFPFFSFINGLTEKWSSQCTEYVHIWHWLYYSQCHKPQGKGDWGRKRFFVLICMWLVCLFTWLTHWRSNQEASKIHKPEIFATT